METQSSEWLDDLRSRGISEGELAVYRDGFREIYGRLPTDEELWETVISNT
jgi:transposase-like protein